MIKSVITGAVGLLIGALFAVVSVKYFVQSQPVPEFHEHADFALFINGIKMDFAKDTYMSTKPCTISRYDGDVAIAYAHADDSDIGEYVHLHDLDGAVIHVHREGITYANFFESLHMVFTDTSFTDDGGRTYENNGTSSWRFFVNGEEVPTLAARPIRELDEVLITYGAINRSMASFQSELGQVSNRACVSSHSCAHRGPVAEESCGATAPKPNALLKWLGI